MSAVAAHYEKHLGPVYTWMIGDLDAAFARGRTELDELGLEPSANGTAIDLGRDLACTACHWRNGATL
jgi:hypothetical protein